MPIRIFGSMLILTSLVITGCSKSEENTSVDGEPVSVMTRSGIDTQYISEDFTVAAVIRPAKILNSPLVKMLSDEGVPVEDAFKDFTMRAGVNLRKIEQVIFLVDQKTILDLPNTFMGSGSSEGSGEATISPPIRRKVLDQESTADKKGNHPPDRKKIDDEPCGGETFNDGNNTNIQRKSPPRRTTPGIGFIVRFSDAVNETELATKLLLKKRIKNGKTYYDRSDDGSGSAHFVDNKTLLFATNGLLPKMMTAKDVSSPLTKLLSTANPDNDIMIVLPIESMKELIDAGLKDAPPPVAQNADLFRSIDALVIAANLSGDSLLNIRLDMNDADSAKKMTAEIQQGLGGMKEEVASSKSSPQSIPFLVLEELVSTIEELVNGISVEQTGKQVAIDMKSISLEKLKPRIEPAMKAVEEEKKLTESRNILKQIALAFHNHHDAFGALPTASSANETKGKGISWRVHLLPFLEQQELYRQFNMKEPWDSEHNKKLISKMPKIFEIPGRKNDGKTNIHVFTGEGTPFNGPKPIRFQDIADGTSNTILCVEASEDKAEFWTKPGGIELTPGKNPWILMGLHRSKRVLAAMMDGRVINFKSYGSEVFRWVIQHNDGNPLNFPKKTKIR